VATGIQLLDDILTFIDRTWPELEGSLPDARVQGWVAEIESGTGRTVEQIRLDILQFVVGDERIDQFAGDVFEEFGLDPATGDETAEERIQRISDELQSGEKTFAGLRETLAGFAPPPQRTPDTIGGRQIPAGMRLIRITDPSGTDAGELFLLVGDVFGVNLAYEIGDRAALDEQFGGITNFESFETFTQAQFDESDTLLVGTTDELGPESLQAQFERDIRSLGLESPPAWLIADREAMTVFVTAVNEGWSTERTNNALSGTQAFKDRFIGLDVVMNQLGTSSITEGIAEFTRREDQIRQSLLASRGPSTDVSQETVTSLIASGWQPAEIEELLGLEKRVRDNPAAMDNINQILVFQGFDPLDPDDFVQFLQDQDALSLDPSFTPSDIFESINDALRFQALLTEGIEVDLGFATELGTGVSEGIASIDQFSRQAQLAAGFIAANQAELNFEKLGLSREDIIAAQFGEVPEGGRPVSEVNQILEQFARERSKAAQGFSGGQSFIDASGRLRTQGFADFA